MKTIKIIDSSSELSLSSGTLTHISGFKFVNQRDKLFGEIKRLLLPYLSGVSKSKSFLLAPIDPGSGKTRLLADFIGEWKADGFWGQEGVLLCFSTKAEIEAFIIASGLDGADYSIQTRDSHLNGLGLGYHGADAARVLLTTHEMIRHHAGDSFETAKQFYYKGKPRRLRVWDEGMSIADPVSIRLDDIGGLYGPLRLHDERFVEELERLIPSTATAKVGDTINLPPSLLFPSKTQAKAIFGEDDPRFDILEKLALLKGQELDIGEDKRHGKTLIGYIHELPDDFAPVFILDGSGRLKESYRLCERHRGNWCRLPSYQHDYANLHIHLWNRASGKSTMMDAANRMEMVDAVAAKINEDDEEWLVVIHKDDEGRRGYNLEKLIRDKIKSGKRRVSIIHWGNHKATNDYRHIKRVMVIGLWQYPDSAYKAIYRASTRLSAAKASADDLRALKRTELQDHLLQGIARSNIRNAGADGKCGEAVVYIIGPAATVNDYMLKETFPGCSVLPWEPVAKSLKGNAAKLVDEVFKQLTGGVTSIAKKSVSDALGINKTALARLLRNTHVKGHLSEKGINWKGRNFSTL